MLVMASLTCVRCDGGRIVFERMYGCSIQEQANLTLLPQRFHNWNDCVDCVDCALAAHPYVVTDNRYHINRRWS